MMSELRKLAAELAEAARTHDETHLFDSEIVAVEKALATEQEQEPVAFDVRVGQLKASNGTTHVVSVNHPMRSKDAEPWDYSGHIELWNLDDKEQAEQMASDVRKVLNMAPLYVHPRQENGDE